MPLASPPPVCLRLAVLGNIHPHRRGSGPREIGSTPADTGDPENGLAARDDRILRPVAPRHTRLHQQAPHRPMPDTTERYQRITRPQGPNLPCAPRNPRRPVTAREPFGRPLRRPHNPECPELRAPSLVAGHHLHNLPILPNLPRVSAAHTHAVERHLRRPPATERLTPPRRTLCQPRQLTRPPRAQHPPRAPRRGPPHGHCQCVIIARELAPGNVKAVLVQQIGRASCRERV